MRHFCFFASLAAALTLAVPASAAIITYDVSISGGSYSTRSSTYDYGSGVNTSLGELAPAVSPLTLTGKFVVDSTQGTQVFPFPGFPFQSGNGTFINSTVTGDQPTPTLATALTGTNNASLVSYAGAQFSLDVSDFVQTLFYDADSNVTRAVNEYWEHTLVFSNVSEFTFVDGKAFPKLNGPGIYANLVSVHGIDDYDYAGGGIFVTSSRWQANAIGFLGDTATATERSSADVPEPASLALFGVGILGVGLRCRRRA